VTVGKSIPFWQVFVTSGQLVQVRVIHGGLDLVTYRSGVDVGRLRLSVGAVGVAGILTLATGCGGAAHALDSGAGATATLEGELLHGGVLSPADAEPAITLTDTSGASYDVATRNRAQVTLVYFGYTHCPDVCPTTMADIATALRQSSPQVRRKVTVVFVTVDPYRDSLPVLRGWLDNFSRSFVGLRGSLHHVIAVQEAAGLPPSKVAKNGKTVEHSAEVLAYTPDRQAHVIYFEGPSTIDDLRHDLPILVNDHGYE
jgi:protein SCO1